MLLIPYSTDAPVYHFPWATIGLILANIATLVTTMGALPMETEYELWGHLCLQFDQINPTQWLTTNFMHDGIVHLFFNMFFLWGFGLVVEGKLGWWKFLLVYLGMGTAYGALVQIVMYTVSSQIGCALGASGVIFGVMGVAAIWAPKNDMNCFLWAGVFSRTLSMTVLNFGLIYLGLQFLFLYLNGFTMSSEALHLSGLAVGLPIGIALLKFDVVDCEGWDYFTLYLASDDERRKRQSRKYRQRQKEKVVASKNERRDKSQQLERSLADALQSGNDTAAIAIFEKFGDQMSHGEKLDDGVSMKLIGALQRREKWETSIPIMVRLLKKHPPPKTVKLRLNLAQVLVKKTNQPRQATAVLKKLPLERLSESQKSLYNRLVLGIRRLKSEGIVELDVHDW